MTGTLWPSDSKGGMAWLSHHNVAGAVLKNKKGPNGSGPPNWTTSTTHSREA